MDRGRLQRQGYSVAALRRMARRRLPRMVFDFCDGAAEDEITRQRNETAFADWAWLWARRGYAAIAMDLSGSQPPEAVFDDQTGEPCEPRPRHQCSSSVRTRSRPCSKS